MDVYVIAGWVITDWVELTEVMVEGGYWLRLLCQHSGKQQISTASEELKVKH